jgi:hypothetical protein
MRFDWCVDLKLSLGFCRADDMTVNLGRVDLNSGTLDLNTARGALRFLLVRHVISPRGVPGGHWYEVAQAKLNDKSE